MLNMTELRENLEGDEEFIAELLALYIEEAPRILAQIEAALSSRDLDGIRMGAHTLRGMSGNVCATKVVSESERLEMAAGSERAHLESIYTEVKGTTVDVIAHAQELLRSTTDG